MQPSVAAFIRGVNDGAVTQQSLRQAGMPILARDDQRCVAKLVSPINRAAGTEQVLCLSVFAVATVRKQLPKIRRREFAPLCGSSACSLQRSVRLEQNRRASERHAPSRSLVALQAARRARIAGPRLRMTAA